MSSVDDQLTVVRSRAEAVRELAARRGCSETGLLFRVPGAGEAPAADGPAEGTGRHVPTRPAADREWLGLVGRFEEGASLLDLVQLEQDLEDQLGFHVEVTSRGGIPDDELADLEVEPL